MELRRHSLILVALLASLANAEAVVTPAADESSPAVDAVWKAQHVDFNFFGQSAPQTIYYNCDSMQGKLEQLLRLAGARSDLKVRTSGCFIGEAQVSPFIHAELDFHSPTLAKPAAGSGSADAPLPAPSQWKPVKLNLGWTRGFDKGDCQLVEQFRRRVLTLFEVRNITGDLPCSLGQAPAPGKASLSFEALTATPAADKESVEQRKQQKKRDDAMKSERGQTPNGV